MPKLLIKVVRNYWAKARRRGGPSHRATVALWIPMRVQ